MERAGSPGPRIYIHFTMTIQINAQALFSILFIINFEHLALTIAGTRLRNRQDCLFD